MKAPYRDNPIRNSLKCLALAGSAARIACSLAALALATTPARSQIISGGDFQLYKPGSTTVTAELTGGYVPWLASIPNPTAPTSLTVGGGSANYSDSTTGPSVDLPGWTKTQGGADLLTNGPSSSMALNLFAAWGGFPRPIVETTGSLHTIGSGETITITSMVGGPATGPKSGSFFFGLFASGVEITPSSEVHQTMPLNDGFQMISRTYGATALAAYIGQTTKIRIAVPDANTIGNRVIFDDVTLVTSVPDTTAPTLISFEDDKNGGPIVVNEPVIYTVTFSEPMSASTVDVSDFANTGATAISVNSVTPTANPAVFSVEVTPTEAGTLQLQVALGASLTDFEGNLLDTDPAILDDSILVVNDLPKTTTTITIVSSSNPSTYGQNVTFTATVSPKPTGGTVRFWDGDNYLGAAVAVNTSTGEASVSTAALGATSHAITAEYSGNFLFEASTTAAPLTQEVGQAPLTVTALSIARQANIANPDPLPYEITGYQNGENLSTSGVIGTPVLTTDATLSSPVGNYVITPGLGSLAAPNYSFTLVNGTLTVTNLAGQLGILNLGANGGINPATGNPWAAGDKYRLVFVTSARTTCDSTDIATYNTFVQGLADAAGLGTSALGPVTWKVVGSTATVAARDNTGTNPEVDGVGEPILRMDGTFVIANDYADLWNGINNSHVAGQNYLTVHLDENGVERTDERVRTGSSGNGTAPGDGRVLGGSTEETPRVQTGRNFAPDFYGGLGGNGWMQDWSEEAASAGRLYAMSGILTIVSTTPTDPYEIWLGEFTFAEGDDTTPTGDPDGDGLSNQEEFAFGLNPTLGSSVNPIVMPLNPATGNFQYTRRATPTATGLTYTVLTSSTLAAWVPGGATEIGFTTAGNIETVTVNVTSPPVAGKLFVRVEATPTPAP